MKVPKPLSQLAGGPNNVGVHKQSLLVPRTSRPAPALIPVPSQPLSLSSLQAPAVSLMSSKPQFEILNVPSRPNIKISSTYTPHQPPRDRRDSVEILPPSAPAPARRPSAGQPAVLNMQEISRDILGLGGDQQRPSSQIISIGGESYLLPQEPLPAPDTQQQLVLSQDQAQQLLFAQQQGPQQVLMEQQQQQQMLIEQPLQQQQMLVEQPLQQQMVIEQPLQQQQMLIEHQQLQVQEQPQQLHLQQQDDQQLVLEAGQQHIFLDEHGRQVVLAPEQQLQLVRQFDEGHQLVQIEEQQEQQLVQLEGENGERVMLSFPEHNHLLFQAQEEGMDLG